MKNFGLLKEAYMEIMLEGLKTGDIDKKNTFKKFIKSIKYNPILKKQAKFYSLLESVRDLDNDKQDDFINEAISMISNSDKKEMIKENILLSQILFEYNIDLTELNYEKKELHESISNLLFLKPELKNLKTLSESKNIIRQKREFIIENKTKKSDEDYLPTKVILKTAVNKINKSFPSLSENEIKIIASVLNGNINEQKAIFDELKKECETNILDKKEEISEQGLLETALAKLSGMEYSPKTYQTDIVKIMSLKNSF